MAVVRIGQLTGETQVLTDFSWWLNRPSLDTSPVHTGTRSYVFDLNIGPMGFASPNPLTEYRLSFWWYMGSTNIDGNTILWQAANGKTLGTGNSNIHFFISEDSGVVSLRRPLNSGSHTTIDSFGLPSQFGTTGSWFHVGITHLIDEIDGYISMYVGGSRVFNYLGDTRPARWNGSALEYSDSVVNIYGPGATAIGGTNGFDDANMDDAFLDSMVGEGDGPVPARRFLMVLPTGAGEDAEWTPSTGSNYQNVDENPNDGDTTYNKALSADLRDTFVMGDVTVPEDHRIVAAVPIPFAKRLDSEIENGISVHAFDGVDYLDSDDIDLTMSYDVPAFARLTQQPDGSQWNETDFNAMQFGYRSRGTF